MGISDKIEAFIIALLKDDPGWVELGRNELASVFGCVPSQINYVISTRFGPERGYLVESRRGGGGYLRIRRMEPDGLSNLAAQLPDTLSYKELQAILHALVHAERITPRLANTILAGLSDQALGLPSGLRERTRARVFQAMLLANTTKEEL